MIYIAAGFVHKLTDTRSIHGMASFEAFLEVGGKRYPLHRYEFSMHQETDTLGRPASPVLGGTITCTLSTPGSQDPFLIQWMLSPTMQQDGKIRLMQAALKATEKTISFFNAYCTNMSLDFQPGQNGGAGSSLMQLVISSQRVAVGAIVHDNNWPLASHGAGETFAKQEPPAPQEPGLISDVAHTVLDVAGLIPGLGEIADGANALFYLAEGNKTDAALSAAAMVPFAGWAATGGKLTRKALKYLDRSNKLKKFGAGKRMSAVASASRKAQKTIDNALDLSKKPKHAPDVKKWQAKGGKIETLDNGSWKYTNKDGVSVVYKNGYPDFNPHARQQVDVDVKGNHTTDFTNADKAAPLGPKLPENTWHHHENMRTMQEVPRKIHRQFTHAGGVAKVKKSVGLKIKKK